MILLQDLCCVIGVAEFDFDVVNGKNIIKPISQHYTKW